MVVPLEGRVEPARPGQPAFLLGMSFSWKLRALVAGAAVLMLVACDPGSSDSASPDGPTVEIFATTLDDARSGGAGSNQLALLEQAEKDHEINLETARDAARGAVQCMTDAGVSATYMERTTFGGLVLPGYQAGASGTADTAWELIEACDLQEFYWVNQLYQGQPTSWQMKVEYANQQEPVLRACLEDNGLSTDPEATGVGLVEQAIDAMGPGEAGAECLDEAGISSW